MRQDSFPEDTQGSATTAYDKFRELVSTARTYATHFRQFEKTLTQQLSHHREEVLQIGKKEEQLEAFGSRVFRAMDSAI